MKKLISHFIKYPITGWVLVIGFVMFGLVGMFSLRSSFFPQVESRDITIRLYYPGASPQEMEEGIVLKVEENLTGLMGIERFTSSSNENNAVITVEVLKGYDIDDVLDEVKSAVDRISSLPAGMEPAVISKGRFRTTAVSFVVSGDVSLKALKEYAQEIESDLLDSDGISQIEISGFPDEEIEIAINESKLRAYGLTFQEISDAVAQSNILVTGGSVKTTEEEYLIRVKNRVYHGDELDYTVIRTNPDGSNIYLKDIALVQDRWSESPDRLYINSKPAIRLTVNATISEDLIDVADKTKAYMEKFNQTHNDVQLDIIRDLSKTIVQRTQLLVKNGIQGIFLVLFFLALFLKPRLAFWVAFGLPIAFLGMFMLAGYFGVTINVLSLFGMIIVIGILVDDGIVISENIYHHYEKGKSAVQAAIDGTMEVVPAIISAILTTVVAFSTFFFVDGRPGDFFSEASVIVILTLVISLVEALIILPSHVAHSKALSKEQKTYIFNAYAERGMNWFKEKIYAPTLVFFLDNKILGFAIPIAMMILTIGSIQGGIIRMTFFPRIASDRVTVTLNMPQGTNVSITDSIISSIEDDAGKVGDEFTDEYGSEEHVIESIVKRIGPGTSTAQLNINLLPGESRAFPSYEMSNALFDEVGEIDQAENVIFGSGGNFGGTPISMALLSDNTAELKGAKTLVKSFLKDNPELKDITDNDPEGIKEIQIQLKPLAYSMGFRLNQVIGQVRSGFFGREIQRFQRGRDEIKIWIRYDEQTRSSIKNLDDMRIISANGDRVPFSEIATYTIERGDISINHLNGKREIRIEGDIKNPKASATELMEDVKKDVLPMIDEQFPDVKVVFEGQNREANKTTSSSQQILPVIIFTIFVIIAFTFRSISQPIILILMVPFSLVGVAWGHWIHDFPINVLSFLGIIALFGIVVNDGLVLIGKFNSYLKEGLAYKEALVEAGKSRFRAIFLTSITTVAGLAPLIFETSRQAKFLIPMAISIAYGIMLATVLTLIMLPMMLATGNTIKVYAIWLWTGRKPTKESVERAIVEMKADEIEH